jgi:hypothetical protein
MTTTTMTTTTTTTTTHVLPMQSDAFEAAFYRAQHVQFVLDLDKVKK